jgi:prolyl oligopeptidase
MRLSIHSFVCIAASAMLTSFASLESDAQTVSAASAASSSPATTTAAASPVLTPPPRVVPEVRPVKETFFGTEVTDPYRYMEDVKNPEVVAFMRGESAHARATLDAIPGRAALAKRIEDLSQGNTVISSVQMTGADKTPRLYFFKLAPGMTSRALFARDGMQGKDRLVFDAASISRDGKRYAIDDFRAAPDGRHVLVAVAAGGSEETSLRIIEVGATTARDTGVVIDRIGFADETRWAPDSKSFFYNRLPPAAADGPKNRYLFSRAFRHILGRPVIRDEAVFGNGLDGITLADIDIPSIRTTGDGKTLVGRVEHGDAREISVYVANAAGIGKALTWRRLVKPEDEITSFQVHQQSLYLLSKKNAPRYKLLRMPVNGYLGLATTVVPQGDTVLAEMSVAKDALYIRELYDGTDRLQRLNFSTAVYAVGKLEFVRLPFDLSIRQMLTSPTRPGALLRLESWTDAPKYSYVEERSGNLVETTLHPRSNADFSSVVELRLKAPAKDGTLIPVSLTYAKSTQLNAFNPTIIRAYGAYGITQNPTFNPTTLAWLERGGILATCHVRGGGEYGEAWHRGGQKDTKPNTWRDLIACAEFLVERGFTRPERMGIQGGSAGGITVGRALTERPELFAAAVPAVGVLDALRMEFTPNGPPNIPEFGTVTNEAGFKGLLAMSALHHVKDGTRYPAIMLMHGVNDPRVEVWHSAKMAARMNAATQTVANRKPVLLRLDYDAGHGVGSSRNQRNAELADVYAFMLWQFGENGFQPVAPDRR